MPKASVNRVSLYYEDIGQGTPIVFVHEFAGETRSWDAQVRFFSRRYRTIAFNALVKSPAPLNRPYFFMLASIAFLASS